MCIRDRYGLQSLERCWLDTKQIEAARVAITRHMKRRGKVCLLYTSDAADERSSVDLGGRRIIKKKKKNNTVWVVEHKKTKE